MANPYYRAIILVLASDNTPLYQEFRKVYQKYLDKNPEIKVFMVYGSGTTFEPQEYDLIYDDIEENYYPGMITKTLRAMEYIDANYTYDFFIRTNISTFWDLDLLLSRLEKQPLTKCFTGTIRNAYPNGVKSPDYIAGVNLVISRDMVKEMISNKELIISWDLPEDWAMSKFLSEVAGATMRPSLPGAIHFMDRFENDDRDVIMAEIELARKMKHDHFRIKNRNRDIDLTIAKVLLEEYYGESLL